MTLAGAAAGGAGFALFALPLPWLMGAMCAIALLALRGHRVVSVKPIRAPFAALIGVTIGATVSPALVASVPQWLPLTLGVGVSTVLTGAVGTLYLRRVAGVDRATAFFAAMPAGVYEMTVQGEAFGADVRRVALAHAIRIFAVVLTVPWVFRWIYATSADAPARAPSGPVASSLEDWAGLIACAAVGWAIARKLHVPNAPMLGPMCVSAVLHGSGLVDATAPTWSLAVAQIVLGASIGAQFRGTTRAELVRSALHGAVLVPLSLVMCVAVALALGPMTSLDLATRILALAPGGSIEMALVAFAVGAEVTAVVLHQVLRVLLVHGGAAAVFRRWR